MKLAKRGGKFNMRVLLLTNEKISYYSKVPPEFEKNSLPVSKNKKGEEIPIIPKLSCHLQYIVAVGPVTKIEFH